ncbi:MAG TPA: lipoate--protein ligase family protein [Planctomycetaceae bacterium]|nr:lipoate--protein ligase family protein [Planctomycetaceae bacterium]
MRLLDLTMPSPAEDLALDEALLEEAESSGSASETLRLWEAHCPFVVMGRSGRVNEEVELARCTADRVPVLRRHSGGGTIVAAPGCAFFSLVLSLEHRPQLRMVDEAHRFVMQTIADGLGACVGGLELNGSSDLTLADRKVSGNSLRIRRNFLLYHGTLLLNMDLQLASKYLKHPPRQPSYRRDREHADFIANLGVPLNSIKQALIATWNAEQAPSNPPLQVALELAATKYRSDEWNLQR